MPPRIEIVRCELIADQGTTRALLTAVVQPLGVVIRSVRVIEVEAGHLFVRMPYRKLPDGTCRAVISLPEPLWSQFERQALQAYQDVGGRLVEFPTNRARARDRRKQRRQLPPPYSVAALCAESERTLSHQEAAAAAR
jgi:DNA-binding cell septation regulator SpoVG